jgi:predicted RNase H-like HicB family nuclease
VSKENLVDHILEKPYTRCLVSDETGGYVASIFEFPGCVAEGDSAEEAICNLN